MDARDFVQQLRDAVVDLQAKGLESITAENLIKYLDANLARLNTTAGPSAEARNELYKAELQKWIEEHKHVHAHSLEMFRSVIQAGQNALRTAFLMNGGAAVALLALVGHLASVDAGRIRGLAPSLATFVTGVLVAALASGATYISQWFYASNQSWDKTGLAFNILAILLGLGSYVVFAVGMWRGYSVLTAF